MKSKDLITLQLVTQGADKVNVDLNKLSSAMQDITLESKATKDAISMLKEENKELSNVLNKAEKQTRQVEQELDKLRKSGDTTSESYNRLNGIIIQLGKDTDRYREKINANKESIENVRKMEEALNRTMQLKDMTMNQLSKKYASLKDRLSNIVKEKDIAKWNKLNNELIEVEQQMNKVDAGGKKVKGQFDNINSSLKTMFPILKGGLMVLAGNLMTKAVSSVKGMVVAFKDWVTEGMDAAGVIEGVTRAFAKLDQGDLLKKLQDQTRGLISDDDLKKAAVRAGKYKIPIQEVGNLLEFAGRRANDMGQSVQDFQERIINGIGRESKLILDELGLSSTEINAEIAKTGSFASAVIQLVNKDLKEQGVLELTAADIRQQNFVVWQNAQGKVGENFLWLEKIWNKFSTAFASDIEQWASTTLPNLMIQLETIINKFVDWYNSSLLLRVGIVAFSNQFSMFFNLFKKEMKNIFAGLEAFADMGKAAFSLDYDGVLLAQAKFLKRVGDNNKQFVKESIKSSLDSTKFAQKTLSRVDVSNMGSSTGKPYLKIPSKTPTKDDSVLAKQKKELDTLLTNLENAHKTELQLLKETQLKTKQTDEEYKISVAKSDKKYYDDRVKSLEAYKKKVSEKNFIADIDKQVVDTTGKSKEQDPIIDKANVDKIGKSRDENLRFEQVGSNQLKRTLATREENEKVSALRMQTLELTSSQNRLTILRQYSQNVQELDIADARQKEELVREAGDAVIAAETDTIQKRKALDKSYLETNKETRERYGKITLSEQKENELAIIQSYYNAGLISEEIFQQASKAIEQKYADKKLEIRERYGIASMRDIQNRELEDLKLAHEQGLLSEKEYLQAKGKLQLKHAAETAQKINEEVQKWTSMTSNAVGALQAAETANLDAQYDARIASAQGNAEEVERLEQEKAQKKLDIEKEYADLQFAMKASDIIANTAVAIMTGYAQLGPIMGSIAAAMLGATGAAQLVTANAERQKVKSMTLGNSGKTSVGSGRIVVGKEEGGYMDVTRQQDGKNFRAAYNPSKRGFVNSPTVIVGEGPAGESLEYVIPNKAMKNPTLRPIIDLIDHESRKGTIGTTDMNQMIRERLAGFQSGGAIGSSVSASSANNGTTVVNNQRQPSDVELETLELLRHLNKNGVFTNLNLGSVQKGLNTLDKEKSKFTFGDK